MKRLLVLALGWLAVMALAVPALARDGMTSKSVARDYSNYRFSQLGGGSALTGGSAAGGISKAAGDTFFLFGGPGSAIGKFQTQPQLAPSRQGWVGVDLTELQPHWHTSDFNAPALPATAPSWWQGAWSVPSPNHATWAGVEAGEPGFVSAPGYGNNWNDWLDYRATVANTAAASTVRLSFLFNHDTEPGYDFFIVQWDSSGSLVDLQAVDADNRDTTGAFSVPAEFDQTVTYAANSYVGPAHNQIHLRLVVQSDGAWSDEDGLWPTDGGAQVDAIQVVRNGSVISQATFEGGNTGGWAPVPTDFVGDFSKVFAGFQDTDPCNDDNTPQMTWIDDGTPPANDALQRSTGGSVGTSSYGIPGGWVVNYTGGLTFGASALNNEVWSPPFAYDLPGTDDDAAVGGAFMRYLVWSDLPLLNGIFNIWHVRSYSAATAGWGAWQDRNFVYFSSPGAYIFNSVLNSSNRLEVSDLLAADPDSVQLAFGAIDLADVFGFPGNDATPSPLVDDISFAKYEAIGPGFATREIEIFQDSFPQSGTAITSYTTSIGNVNDLAIRIDMAQDIRPAASPGVVAGDSAAVTIKARKPGAVLDTTSIRMDWVLDANPAFNAARAAGIAALAAGPGSSAVQLGPNRWRGHVNGRPSLTAGGARVADRYFFDLPDGPAVRAPYQSAEPALFFPGDVLRYCFVASTLTPAETALLPADTSGFASGEDYNRTYVMRGLPAVKLAVAGSETTVTQPRILMWNDFGRRGGENEFLLAFSQNGLVEGVDYDTYTTQAPDSGINNGLGSAGVHGANALQLEGYDCLIYEAGDLENILISDGSGAGSNDKSADVGALTAWNGQAHNRFAAYFGDDIATGLGGGGLTYRANVMGVATAGTNVLPSIGGQSAPRVAPTGEVAGFITQYVAFGGCPGINVFDNISASVVGAKRAHQFLPGPYAPSASVYYARQDTIAAQSYDRVHVTFPYGFVYVWDTSGSSGTGGGRSARANLLRELLLNFGHSLDDGNAVATDPVASRRLAVAQNRPNPFNPSTTIEFTAPARGEVVVRIFNVRGEVVSTLLRGTVDAGPHAVNWNGRDAAGAAVASGIYLYQVSGFGQEITRKMALVK